MHDTVQQQPIKRQTRRSSRHTVALMGYDAILLLVVDFIFLVIYPSGSPKLPLLDCIVQFILSFICIFGCRVVGGIYNFVWRYGRTGLYIRLILLDMLAALCYLILNFIVPVAQISAIRIVNIATMNLVAAMSIRFVYQYLYEYGNADVWFMRMLRGAASRVCGVDIKAERSKASDEDGAAAPNRINIAIVGAGRVGVGLAEELTNNPNAFYKVGFFIDIDKEKIGRSVNGIPVFSETQVTQAVLARFHIQEIVFALPNKSALNKRDLYNQYKATGLKLKVYDYPTTRGVENGKRHMREFDIEELLFRQPVEFMDECTRQYYRGKTVLISGGGGSIGSELCRQIARVEPKKLVVLDVYENGAYDIQQELRIAYGEKLELAVEIISVCDRPQLERVFEIHRPDVVLHAAAHKHVPLMEHNCCEAVKNNVFGTLTIVETAEKYGVAKFIMISTDKAVNPTNVMGATKRMCEMIVQNRTGSKTSFSATRFGNVLGSNGSVIPLFRRQIMNGGPVTLTDKRIIRYFMTIPEASQLVLTSGAMAKNGELYVLDMGKPVKILELAENMIRLSGFEPYKDIDIVETGLRPGEKLFEELLIKNEELDKTDNDLIFVERDRPKGDEKIQHKLDLLREAVGTRDDAEVRQALKRAVSTFHEPDEVNAVAGVIGEVQAATG